MYRVIFTIAVSVFVFSSCLFSPKSENDKEGRGYVVKVGDPAPDFEIEYLDGTKIHLSDLKGKVVMLQFAASWCSVCRKEMPYVESNIWQKYKDNPNFALIAIDLKESREDILKFIEATKISYPVTLDITGSKFALYAEKDSGVTRNVIIDRNGKIILLTRLFEMDEFNSMVSLIDAELKK